MQAISKFLAATAIAVALAGPVQADVRLTTAQLKQIGMEVAASAGVPWRVLDAVITEQSKWDPNAVNEKTGLSGLAGLSSVAAGRLGIDALNPKQSLVAAARLLSLYQSGGSWQAAVTIAYGIPVADEPLAVAAAVDKAAGASWHPIAEISWFENSAGRGVLTPAR